MGVTTSGGMSFTKTGAFSALFSTEMSVLMLSLQTRDSQVDAQPLFRCWGQASLGSCCILAFASSPHRAVFAPEHPDVLEPNCKGDIATSDGKAGLKGIVNKSEMRNKKSNKSAGEERREQYASGCHDWSSPGKAPVHEVKTRLTLDHFSLPHCEVHLVTQLSL